MLKIRRFVKECDEKILIRIYNATIGTFDDARSMTLRELEKMEESPSFSTDGIFIAEMDGETAGMISAHVDKLRREEKGFVQLLGILPEFRGKGIAKKLVEKSLESLEQRGMKVAETMVQTDREACMHIFESFGFKQVRSTSMMNRSLSDVSSRMSENKSMSIREMRQEDKNEFALLNNLVNKTFKEHFGFRPKPIDETRFTLLENPFFRQRVFFAVLDGDPVGFVMTGINDRLNREKNRKYGWIQAVGVLKPARQKGIGIGLMFHAMKLLKKQRMIDAVLYVDDMNPTGAMKLYEELGFRVMLKDIIYQMPLV